MDQNITNEAATLGALQLFLEEHYPDAIQELTDQQEQTSVSVDFTKLLYFNPDLATHILETPTRTLPLFDLALIATQRHLFPNSTQPLTTVRVHGLPSHPALTLNRMPNSQDTGRLLSISGTVIRFGLVKMMETSKQYRCGKCQGHFNVLADIEQYNHIPRPTRCLAPGQEFCNSTAFHPSAAQVQQNCVDYQELKIQEQVGKLALGTIPRTTVVILEGDLVDSAKSGDTVTVTGTVIRRWRPVMRDERPDISLALRANHMKVHTTGGYQSAETTEDLRKYFQKYWNYHQQKETQMRARDLLVASMCPQVYGLFYVKLAVLLVVIGGVARTDQSGLRIRGEAHLLMVGDPGTAKSQFLKYASKLVPRSVLTTGIGSTSAGLTVTAVRDGAEWALEAGALVLADRGICCIDEFGSIREAEKSTILEAMEQQSISVAKAGIVCKLNSRCSVLAAMNPKGQYDPHASLSVNTALSSPLLSRFDLIMVLLDASDSAWDERVAGFLLCDSQGGIQENTGGGREFEDLWSFDRLQAYIAYVKSSIDPVSTEESERILTKYYQMQRQRDQQNASRTTIRLLESLIRLSQAHARLMLRDKVHRMDAVMAVVLMETTMASASLLGTTDCLHTVFPTDSDLFYSNLEQQVLKILQIN